MSYTAQNLDEIAAMFEHFAKEAKTSAALLRAESHREGEAYAWKQAAYILRRVTLTEPAHMENTAYFGRREHDL